MSSNLIDRRNRVFGKGAPLFYREPLHIVKGEGTYLFDQDGRRYVDMYNNVPCVGHAHPRIVEAIAKQQSTLNVHSRYLHEDILELAERLTGLHKGGMDAAIFSCTGTEANEVALRLVRACTGKRGIICSDAAYHGNSEAVGKLTHVRRKESDMGSDVQCFPYPQMFRPVADVSTDSLCDAYLNGVKEAIDRLNQAGHGFAGLLICSLFANEGLPDIPEGFMSRAAKIVREAGGMVISDEVQSGYCRSGHWWGYEISDFEPDVVVTGKPMGAGVPLAATVSKRASVETFRQTGYFNTFASSPLQAAVGLAVIDIIEEENLATNASVVGSYLKSELKSYQKQHEIMGDVRGHGLFIAVDCIKANSNREPDREIAVRIVEGLKERGFLTGVAGSEGNVVKIRPPLVFGQQDAENFLEGFKDCLRRLDGD